MQLSRNPRENIFGSVAGIALVGLVCLGGHTAAARRAQRQTALPARAPQYDLLITNGHIIDGSGSPWFSGSIGVKDGKIVDIGRLVNPTALRTIDAAGLVVTPGFIDLHCHSDFPLLVDGNGQSMLHQGVTEILGEHASAGPILGSDRQEVDRMQRQGFSPNRSRQPDSQPSSGTWTDPAQGPKSSR